MLDRRGRRVALSNLRVAFGDEISAEGRAQIVRQSYQHFVRTMLDFFWSPRLTSQNFSRYVLEGVVIAQQSKSGALPDNSRLVGVWAAVIEALLSAAA